MASQNVVRGAKKVEAHSYEILPSLEIFLVSNRPTPLLLAITFKSSSLLFWTREDPQISTSSPWLKRLNKAQHHQCANFIMFRETTSRRRRPFTRGTTMMVVLKSCQQTPAGCRPTAAHATRPADDAMVQPASAD